jgi:hypothetical protein
MPRSHGGMRGHVLFIFFFPFSSHLHFMAKKSWVNSARRTILIENKGEYDAADVGPERTAIMTKLKAAIRATTGTKIPKKLTQVSAVLNIHWMVLNFNVQAIDLWYLQLAHGDGVTAEAERKWTKKWNLRKVVMQRERDAINGLINAEPGSTQYLLEYPTTCSQVIEELSADQRKTYVALAKAWNEAGPPRDIQLK